ncbi:hypothetical protein [uncultured Tateyamaria sp.]|uniref:hypothetical protein n=1 Tax=uncultured Tateyamaria sp. TaxID=455651 RepID=UPI00263153F0|nr:hypothetical protein [uncultured Tateyamaria sp.]
MIEPHSTGAHRLQPVAETNDDQSVWLTVSEAVLRCTDRGLPRTPKTVRKWAARSFSSPENADISVRREDTDNGFRWSVEQASLDRKINEELEFEARKSGKRVDTGAKASAPVPEIDMLQNLDEPRANQPEPVQTGTDISEGNSRIEEELRARLEQTQQEVEFLRDELRHRRKTDEALGSVIEAFRLNSEANQSQALKEGGGRENGSWQHSSHHDIVRNTQQEDAR